METHVSQEYAAEFNPQEYLRNYYAGPDTEDRFITRFMVSAMRRMPHNLLSLELGGGPTLFAVATLAPQSREIHFCDYLPENLDEVQRWLTGQADAYDWRPYIEMSMQEEGVPVTTQTMAQRIADMRRKVTRLFTCNALSTTPLAGKPQKYDLVVAQTSLDAMSSDIEQWRWVMRNVSDTLVAPRGWLLISVVSGTEGYSVGEKRFPVLPLTLDEVYRGYVDAGFAPNTYLVEEMKAPDARDYVGLITAAAQKLG